jgi:hypothetical protein
MPRSAVATEANCALQAAINPWSTDDLQKLPCTFEFDGPGLGFLEGNFGEDVKRP